MQQNQAAAKPQINRKPLDEWSIKEKLTLASLVAKMGDQHWMTVSRSMKSLEGANRPADWFHQKNCAAQYCALLSTVETPKRKSRGGNGDAPVEPPVECIKRRLVAERKAELTKLMAQAKSEYKQIQDDIKLIKSGQATEQQIDKWDKEIDEEELKKGQDAMWLKQRETKKQDMEKVLKSIKPSSVAQKRKLPEDFEDTRDDTTTTDNKEAIKFLTTTPPPTSQQLKSYFDIQQQLAVPQQEPAKPALSPLLTSLLKSPSQVQNITPTPSILHNVITSSSSKMAENSPAITSLLNTNLTQQLANKVTENPNQLDLLDDSNIKIDDLAKSILEEDSQFLEIKKEEVDDIISKIIENHDIVDDPEQHLQLDKNGDISINLEIDDLEPEPVIEPKKQAEVKKEKPAPVVDPFEFQEDPVIFESPVKPSTLKQEYVPLYQQQSPIKSEERKSIEAAENPIATETVEENKSNNEKDVEEIKPEIVAEVDTKETETSSDQKTTSDTETVKQQSGNNFEDLYDDNIKMEVKIDKTGGTKRDYSRPKKKEDKSFDMLLMSMDKNSDPTLSDDGLKRTIKTRLKSESERSFSPWTEDEDSHSKPPKPETPIDSFPNSPASGTVALYEDDKEHRNWKKSVMLVYNRLASNRYASLFRKPITDEQAPCYSNLIYKPMDLLTIKKNIDSGIVRTSLQLKRDIMLMFQNALMYNKTNGTVYTMALQMQQESLEPIEILLQAEGKVETPVRRETRTSESGFKKKSRLIEEGGKKKKKED
ncbi:unnamed protein product [Ceutorhynchus assimilis]|uniref:Bromo domain-containing protein n=1 Tax=Ceutorhynchus assimilis TaxID=467358 RepID=A0A9N9QT99_9CUCU|nr:unnamed protein product [Ceutorhynchus assimilis]